MSNYERIKEQILHIPGVLADSDTNSLNDRNNMPYINLEAVRLDPTLYDTLLHAQASALRDLYPRLPEVIVGVNQGGAVMARDVANVLDRDIVVVETEYDDRGGIQLSYLARLAIRSVNPEFVLVMDDVSERGGAIAATTKRLTANVARCRASIKKIEAFVTWQKKRRLPKLHHPASRIPYHAFIIQDKTTSH